MPRSTDVGTTLRSEPGLALDVDHSEVVVIFIFEDLQFVLHWSQIFHVATTARVDSPARLWTIRLCYGACYANRGLGSKMRGVHRYNDARLDRLSTTKLRNRHIGAAILLASGPIFF
jgi:hypothetical protein